jgi:FAD/FMN-containing dehydrogenase
MRTQVSWGRLSDLPHDVIPLSRPDNLKSILKTTSPGLARGNGRSYGDACLNPEGVLWTTVGLDHLIAFDQQTGLLTCESGVLLRDIQALVVPRGWTLPVTPGTQMITVGGAIANDVHGKNHHGYGCFGDHVQQISLLRTDGEEIVCGPNQSADWFAATLGGVGLTGLITQATIQLRTIPGSWLETETIAYQTLDEFFSLSDQSESSWEHSVSWVDCVAASGSRGLFMRGNFVEDAGRKPPLQKTKRMPFVPPISLVNQLTLRPFNEAYFWLNKRKQGIQLTHYQPFFYPLDGLLEWNRMYGPKGFYQYQSVVPREAGEASIAAMLSEIKRSNQGSFLAVLKTFGDREALGMLSFAKPGVTLALDFPNKGAETLALFQRLDSIVREAKGRIYLAKDARMPRDLFESGYPRLSEFRKYRDPGISSAMSRRLID